MLHMMLAAVMANPSWLHVSMYTTTHWWGIRCRTPKHFMNSSNLFFFAQVKPPFASVWTNRLFSAMVKVWHVRLTCTLKEFVQKRKQWFTSLHNW